MSVKNTNSHPEMLEWQYRTLISELSHVTLHAQDDSCPCNQVHLGDDGKYPGEFCLGKHLLNVQSLALETALMDSPHADMLDDLASEALEFHETAKKIYCKGGTWPDLAKWSRDARKKLEPVYYACSTKKGKLSDVVTLLDYQPNRPKGLLVQAEVSGIVPKEFEKFKVQVDLKRHPAWNIKDAPTTNNPRDLQKFFRLMRTADREWILVICLNTTLQLTGLFEMSIGNADSAILSPMEVARVALLTNATTVILAHNHPSGDPRPSDADRRTFAAVKTALKMFEIEVPDFMVVGHKQDYSIAGEKTLNAPEISIHQAAPIGQGVLMDPGAVKISGTCDSGTCAIKVSATNKIESSTSSLKNLDKIIKDVEARAAKKGAAVSNKTFALGINGVTKYNFEYRIVRLNDLVVSHDPFTFVPNPTYPQELQPRLRERSATQLQVKTIAANLEPDALLVDYKSIDRGAPIVGPDMVVESGNGRIMALTLAAKEFPDVYAKYKLKLAEVSPSFGVSTAGVENPVLVRVRLTKVSRKQFAEEANSSTTIETSAVEKARTDAEKITQSMLSSLEVLEGEAIEDALRSARNRSFVTSFLNKLSQNEQAKLVDAKGILNQDGVRRMAMAIFVATFRGDVGLKLAEKFFESTDVNVRNVFGGITRALGILAQAETLAASGERASDYSIGEDLAKAISVYSSIKKTPGMTVDKYLKQASMLDRELN
ncbi:MAG: JAB domain-containing protein, partial [Candidatus Marinimicrobia bacterium]|nr:JAB domain-containing protein [Candidatus Neomarinimicrobiota bacterium]